MNSFIFYICLIFRIDRLPDVRQDVVGCPHHFTLLQIFGSPDGKKSLDEIIIN